MNATLVVLHVGALWLPVDAGIEAQLLSVLESTGVSQHEVDVLVELFIGGILAVHSVALKLCKVDAIVAEVEPVVCAVVEVERGNVGESLFFQRFLELVIDHHLAVAVLEAILAFVADLYDGSFQDGLGVADAPQSTVVLGRRHGVLVVGIHLSASLIVLDDRAAVGLIVALAVIAAQIEGDISTRHEETTVDLQFAVDVVVVVVATVQAFVAIDAYALGVAHRFVLLYRVGQSGVERTLVESDATVVRVAVAVTMAKVGTEQDVGHTVGEPLKTEVGVDVLVPVCAVTLGIRELACTCWQEHLAVRP